MSIKLAGTAARNGIHGYGGFNKSEYSIQDHTFKKTKANYNEQNRSGYKYAGKNALNAPKSTSEKQQKLPHGPNQIASWREQTLPASQPAQVAGGFGALPFSSADTSMLQWRLGHGFGQNDPSLVGMIDERNVAPIQGANWRLQSDPYLHSDVGVPSVIGQNVFDMPTSNNYPSDQKTHVRGKHDHTNLREHSTPAAWNTSNTTVATFHTYAGTEFPVVGGYAGTINATRDPINRPLLYSDIPRPPQPN